MDLETVRLMEQFATLCLSIGVAVKLSSDPAGQKLNLENLHKMMHEHQKLAVDWLNKHAYYGLDGSDDRYHYFPKIGG